MVGETSKKQIYELLFTSHSALVRTGRDPYQLKRHVLIVIN